MPSGRMPERSVHLLHLGRLISSTFDFFQGRQVVVVAEALIIVIDAQAELDHAVDAPSKLCWLVEVEARGEQGGIEKEPDEVLHCFIGPVCTRLLLQLGHDGMFGVHLHGLFRDHVRRHGVVAERLRLHDALHVRAPAILGGRKHTRGVGQTRAYDDLFHLIPEHLLHELGERLELGLQFLEFLFLVLVVDVQSLFRHRLEFLAVELLELLHGVLVDGVDHVKYLQALLPQRLEEGRGRYGCHTFACDVIDVVLTLLHAVDVLLEADLFVTRLRALVPHQLRDLRAVCGILVHSELQALAELFVELFVIVLLLSDLREHLQALFHQVFLDDPEDFVLLERLPGDVQWEVFGIHDALHEVQPLGHELVAIVHDEDAAHVQLDVVALLLGLEQIEGRSPRHEEQSAKLQLTLHAKVLHRQMVFPVIAQRFVKRCVFLICDVLGLSHPERLVLVQLLPLVAHLLHLLGLFLLLLLFLFLVNFFNLRLVTLLALLLLLLFVLFLRIRDLLFFGLFHVKLNGETNELRVLLHEILEAALLQKLRLVLLEVANHLGAPFHLAVHKLCVLLDCERTARRRLPNVLLVVVVL
mmetsp:Transcript_26698/g.74554  ORF Transcript_26698/g.74554 Transcript_26698/m.74554 type:complete len:584 (+) Transcript_26698:103-1854(+)